MYVGIVGGVKRVEFACDYTVFDMFWEVGGYVWKGDWVDVVEVVSFVVCGAEPDVLFGDGLVCQVFVN